MVVWLLADWLVLALHVSQGVAQDLDQLAASTLIGLLRWRVQPDATAVDRFDALLRHRFPTAAELVDAVVSVGVGDEGAKGATHSDSDAAGEGAGAGAGAPTGVVQEDTANARATTTSTSDGGTGAEPGVALDVASTAGNHHVDTPPLPTLTRDSQLALLAFVAAQAQVLMPCAVQIQHVVQLSHAMTTGMPVLLLGSPGCGKTTTWQTLMAGLAPQAFDAVPHINPDTCTALKVRGPCGPLAFCMCVWRSEANAVAELHLREMWCRLCLSVLAFCFNLDSHRDVCVHVWVRTYASSSSWRLLLLTPRDLTDADSLRRRPEPNPVPHHRAPPRVAPPRLCSVHRRKVHCQQPHTCRLSHAAGGVATTAAGCAPSTALPHSLSRHCHCHHHHDRRPTVP